MNTPLTRKEVKDLPIGFTPTSDGTNRSSRRASQRGEKKSNCRKQTRGRKAYRQAKFESGKKNKGLLARFKKLMGL
jgi:hypothetical protein